MSDSNWNKLAAEYSSKIGRKYIRGYDGLEYTFFGLVDGYDDYYYGMHRDGEKLVLSSCVGSLEGSDFTEVADSKGYEDILRERHERITMAGEMMNEIHILTCNKSDFNGTFADPPWGDENVVMGAYTDHEKAHTAGRKYVQDAKGKSEYDCDKWNSYEVKAYEIIE